MSAASEPETAGEAPVGALALVGGGRAARSLAAALDEAGLSLAWRWTRREGRPLEAQPRADVVLLAVADRAIEEVAAALARRPSAAGEVWLHLSGSRPGVVARADETRPRSAGAFHPLQSLDGSAAAGARLRGAVAGLDGDPGALAAGAALARRLGMRPLALGGGSKPLYHAAAVMAAGHVAALFAQACRTLSRCGLSPDEARAALHPLLAGTVDNLGRAPAAQVQTGPVPRGDVATVAGHLKALDQAGDERAARAYRALADEALSLASRELHREEREALRRALGLPRDGDPR